jgi:hypothetical protein
MECSARDGKNTEFIFAEAAKLLLNDYIRYKIGNPSIGRTKSIKKIEKDNKNKSGKKKCC